PGPDDRPLRRISAAAALRQLLASASETACASSRRTPGAGRYLRKGAAEADPRTGSGKREQELRPPDRRNRGPVKTAGKRKRPQLFRLVGKGAEYRPLSRPAQQPSLSAATYRRQAVPEPLLLHRRLFGRRGCRRSKAGDKRGRL